MKRHACKLIFAVALTLVAASANAQSDHLFALNWFTIDGGGGASAGGEFAVSGTIGQPDAGVMSTGQFSVCGGFWSGVIQTSGAPLLGIQLFPGYGVRVYWPRSADDFILDEASAIASTSATAWSQVAPATYQTNATHISVFIPNPAGMRLYRLRR